MAAPPATFAHDRVSSAAWGGRDRSHGGGHTVLTVPAPQQLGRSESGRTTVLNRVLKDGESQRLEARQEVLLSVGNAGGIAVTLNDRPLGPIGRDGEVKKGFAINAQTLPALLAAGGAAPSPPPAPTVAVSPRPRASRPPSPSPSPSPSDGVLLIAPRSNTGFGAPGLVPPASSPSPRRRLLGEPATNSLVEQFLKVGSPRLRSWPRRRAAAQARGPVDLLSSFSATRTVRCGRPLPRASEACPRTS